MIRIDDMARKARSAAADTARSATSTATIPVWIAVIIGLIGAIVFVVMGGLRPAENTPAAYGPGEEVRTGQFTVTALSAQVASEFEDQYFSADDGEIIVAVTVRIENLNSRPITTSTGGDRVSARLAGGSGSMIDIPGFADGGRAFQAWMADGSPGTVVLQPNVPAEVVFAWSVPKDAVTDGSVILDVFEPSLTRGSYVVPSAVELWTRGDQVAQITLPTEGS